MNIPTQISKHAHGLHSSQKKNCRTAEKPAIAIHRVQNIQALGRNNDCALHNRQRLNYEKTAGTQANRKQQEAFGIINFKTDEFEVTTATTVEEAKTALSAGFDYVNEKNGIMLLRRPKRFGKL